MWFINIDELNLMIAWFKNIEDWVFMLSVNDKEEADVYEFTMR